MRIALVLGFWFITVPVLAQDKSTDQTPPVVLKAIKAHGGVERIDKLRCAKISYILKGNTLSKLSPQFLGGSQIQVTETYQLPYQMRKDLVIIKAGKRLHTYSWALNKDFWWQKEGSGKVKVMQEKKVAEGVYRPFVILENISYLPEVEAEWQPGKTEKYKDRELTSVTVKTDFLTGILYFDSNTGLLTKVKNTRSLPTYKEPVVIENFFDNYKDVDGLKLPMTLLTFHDGMPAAEMAVTSVQLLETIDKKVFAEPE
jgi:hypothetical protein